MLKTTSYLMVILILACAVPVLAQGPFTDVPADHWAYDAVNQLQQDGILIGYPDGTFAGKRTITRYEFAVAIARLMGNFPTPAVDGKPTGLVTQQQLKDAIAGVKSSDISGLATKGDVDSIKKLVDEFRDEIAALGVDVDALKRDVAALCARVDAIELEQKRVRLGGDVSVFAVAGTTRQNTAIDLDSNSLSPVLLRNTNVVKDLDLKIVGRVNESTTANATINYGNYLTFLTYVDDYVQGIMPTTSMDGFLPYYLYIDAGIGKGALTVGRFPLQFTPYTLKMIDVDSYTVNSKTDSGNYPVDGAKLAINMWGVDWTLFAARNNENAVLTNGLTGQPNSVIGVQAQNWGGAGNAVGGMLQVTQSAGARAVVSLPLNAVVGATYYQAWDGVSYATLRQQDQARVYGVDLAIPLPILSTINFAGSWTKSDALASSAVANSGDVDYLNIAWDGKLTGNIAKLGIGAGYKDIGRNFTAAGSWDKIGNWTNPVNVKGAYMDLNYSIMDDLKVVLDGEYLAVKDTSAQFTDGDKIVKAEAAVKWGFAKSCAVDVSYQYVNFVDKTANGLNTKANYLTVGLDHKVSTNADLNVSYQMIKTDGGNSALDTAGGKGVVQFGVSF